MTIIGLMGGAIAALFGFCVWLFKLILTRQDKRIETLEAREITYLGTIAENAKTAAVGINALADAFKEIRLLLMNLMNLRPDADRR
jgi:hypothetical protein